jgi:hypothetical protein
MRKSIGRMSSALLETLLPSARAYACTPPYCQTSGTKHRCCQNCSGGVVSCGSYTSGKCTSSSC